MTSSHPTGIGRPRTASELHDQYLICPVSSGAALSPRPSDPPEWCYPGSAALVPTANRAALRHYSRQPGGASLLATPTGRV